MEDLKWLFKKYGLLLLILLIVVILSVLCWSKLHGKPEKKAEEVWEPPVIISEKETETIPEETVTETSEETAFWFLPQSDDCLLSETEKQQIQDQVLLSAE